MPAKYTQPQKPEDPNAEFLTIQETAYVLRCSVRTIRRHIADGSPHSRVGRGIVMSRADRQSLYDKRQAGVVPPRTKPGARARRGIRQAAATPANGLSNAA